MQPRPLLGIALALAAAGGYGLQPPLARLAFDNGVPAWESALFRSSATIVAFAAAIALLRVPLFLPRASWLPLLALAASTALVSLSYLVSVEFIPVGLAVIIFYTFPVLVLLVSPLLERRPLGLGRLGVASVAFAGLAVAVGPGFGELDIRGVLFAGLAAASAAVQLFAARSLSARMPPVAFGLVAHLLLWPFMLAAALWWSGGTLRLLSFGVIDPIGYAAVAALGMAYIATYFVHMQSLSFASASTVAPFFNLEPLITMAIAAVLLGERLSGHQYVGAAMVLTALLLAGLEGRARRAFDRRR